MPMVYAGGRIASLLLLLLHLVVLCFLFPDSLQADQSPATLVPAIITFGDSTVDVGNNNYIPAAMFKANYPPYGRDFTTRKPTGRFCDGKLVTDFTAETLGFTRFPPAYLSPEASTGETLLLGANFASAGSGYYEETAASYNALSLGKQVEYYREYRAKLVGAAGESKAGAILAGAMHLLSTGNGDYVQNYYINSTLRRRYTRHEFSSLLLSSFATFVKDLHGLGARRIGATTLPPLGCLPAPISLFGVHGGRNACIAQFNADVEAFNRDLNATANRLSSELPGLTLVVLDIYQPLMELIASPSKHGFTEVRKGCCGTGTSRTSVLCSRRSLLGAVCLNAGDHVFWDGVHPSQAANEFIAESIMVQGIPLIA